MATRLCVSTTQDSYTTGRGTLIDDAKPKPNNAWLSSAVAELCVVLTYVDTLQ